MKQPYRFASTSVIMALGSMVSRAAQALLGVAMLHFFTPQAAGGFAITAQVAFFWVSLSLAQGCGPRPSLPCVGMARSPCLSFHEKNLHRH